MNKKRQKQPFARLEWDSSEPALPSPSKLELRTEVCPPVIGEWNGEQGRLICADNLPLMLALKQELTEGIDLIYADPPFLTGNAYRARIGQGEDSRKPSEWETIDGYRDTWRDGAEYLDMLYPRLRCMYDLLSETGSLYLHLDWHASAYARVILDELFGPDRLLNEIIWVYHGPSPIRSAFNRKHDTILVYTKSKEYTFNADAVRIPYAESTKKTFASSEKAGFGKKPDLERGKVPEDWWYFPVVARLHNERTGFPTQKPEALLDRIIRASSNPGDLVADFFCGSGTTPVVSQRLERRWIACDPSQQAVYTTYRRLLLMPEMSGFSHWEDGVRSSPELSLDLFIAHTDMEVNLEVHLPDEAQEQLVLIDVDWDYDAKSFKSCAHKALPWREKEFSKSFHHTYAERGTYSIRARVVDAASRTGEASIQIKM